LYSRHSYLGEPIRAHSSKKSLHFKRYTEDIVQSERQITSIGQLPFFWAAHTHAAFYPKLNLALTTHLFFDVVLEGEKASSAHGEISNTNPPDCNLFRQARDSLGRYCCPTGYWKNPFIH
jgi:hypothetical protein